MLFEEARADVGKLGADDGKASAGSSLSDMSEKAAAAGQLAKNTHSLSIADELSATDPWLEDTSSGEDSLEEKSATRDIVKGSDSLLERAGEKESAAKESAEADSFLQGREEADLERVDGELSIIGNTVPSAMSATAEKARAEALESDRDPFLLDSELDADRDVAGSSDAPAKPSASETARAVALSAEDELLVRDDDLEMLKAEDDPFLRGSRSDSLLTEEEAGSTVESQPASKRKAARAESEGAGALALTADDEIALGDDSETLTVDDDLVLSDSGSSSLRSGTEGKDLPGTLPESSTKADAADWKIQEERSTISLMDELEEDWGDDALLSDDELLEDDVLLDSDDAGRALDR